jgi:hypothetical protein
MFILKNKKNHFFIDYDVDKLDHNSFSLTNESTKNVMFLYLNALKSLANAFPEAITAQEKAQKTGPDELIWEKNLDSWSNKKLQLVVQRHNNLLHIFLKLSIDKENNSQFTVMKCNIQLHSTDDMAHFINFAKKMVEITRAKKILLIEAANKVVQSPVLVQCPVISTQSMDCNGSQ